MSLICISLLRVSTVVSYCSWFLFLCPNMEPTIQNDWSGAPSNMQILGPKHAIPESVIGGKKRTRFGMTFFSYRTHLWVIWCKKVKNPSRKFCFIPILQFLGVLSGYSLKNVPPPPPPPPNKKGSFLFLIDDGLNMMKKHNQAKFCQILLLNGFGTAV